MYCKNCGSENDDVARFCRDCGRAITGSPPSAERVASAHGGDTPDAVEASTNARTWMWIAFGAGLVVVLLVAGLLVLGLEAVSEIADSSPETDREALAALFHATDGPSWLENDNWLTDVPLSEWTGVTTDEDGRVTELDLAANELSGRIPPELGNLDRLRKLDLTAERTVTTLSGSVRITIGGDSPSFSSQVKQAGKQLAESAESTIRKNHLSGCIPISLREQLDLNASDLGGLPFCDEMSAPTGEVARAGAAATPLREGTEGRDEPPASAPNPTATANPTATPGPTYACSGGSDPTPLHRAVNRTDLEVVRILADKCFEDLNVVSDEYFYDQTPLSLAIWKGHKEIVWVLVTAGANPDIKINPAFRVGTHLTYAVGLGDAEVVQILLDAGADPNVVDTEQSYDQTPLSLAIGSGRTDLLRKLIAAGADPNVKINPAIRVGTHLTYAVGLGDAEVVQILLDAGADPNVVDTEQSYDQTPLSLAIGSGRTDLLRKLIAAGADPNVKINPAFRVGTHLAYAVGLGDAEVVQILLDASADPNVVDTEQLYEESPLSIAVKAEDIEMVRVLVSAGADPNTKLDQFSTVSPLDIAIREGYTAIERILRGTSN